jgi:ribosomal protein S18 acetylase RimI-like enzyme
LYACNIEIHRIIFNSGTLITIGPAIVEALIAEAQGWVRSLHLTLVAHNTRAKILYESCGFGVYGREPQSVRQGDDYVDELLMWRHVV